MGFFCPLRHSSRQCARTKSTAISVVVVRLHGPSRASTSAAAAGAAAAATATSIAVSEGIGHTSMRDLCQGEGQMCSESRESHSKVSAVNLPPRSLAPSQTVLHLNSASKSILRLARCQRLQKECLPSVVNQQKPVKRT